MFTINWRRRTGCGVETKLPWKVSYLASLATVEVRASLCVRGSIAVWPEHGMHSAMEVMGWELQAILLTCSNDFIHLSVELIL